MWGTLPHCWWECKQVQPLWNAVWEKSMRSIWGITLVKKYHKNVPSNCDVTVPIIANVKW